MYRVLTKYLGRTLGQVKEINLLTKQSRYLIFSRSLARQSEEKRFDNRRWRNRDPQNFEDIDSEVDTDNEPSGRWKSKGPPESSDEDLDLEFDSRPLLSKSLTPDLEKLIVEDKIGYTFMLKQVLGEIIALESRPKNPMPLPASLEVEQWQKLISLNDERSRFHYLDSLEYGSLSWDEVLAMDEAMSSTLEVSEEQIKEAVGEDEEGRRRIQMFLMQHEMKRQDGEKVPWKLNLKQLIEISKITSMSGINKYIQYRNGVDFMKISETIKKRIVTQRREPAIQRKIEAVANEKHLYYALGENSILLRTTNQKRIEALNWFAVREFVNGVPLIIDSSYMAQHKIAKNVRSLIFNEYKNSCSFNRESVSPFALHFTDVDPEMEKMMVEALPGVKNPEFQALVTSQSHLDMFPRERLVYLSPDSRNDLVKFDEDDIYVIGGLIDRGNDQGPHTLSRAKRLKVRHARLPLRKTLGFTGELNVDTVVAIMTDMKAYQDWFYAFRWVPARFFGNRLKTGEGMGNKQHLEHKLTYRAHKALSPTTSKGEVESMRNRRLNNRQYRDMYSKIMKAKSYEELQELMESLKV